MKDGLRLKEEELRLKEKELRLKERQIEIERKRIEIERRRIEIERKKVWGRVKEPLRLNKGIINMEVGIKETKWRVEIEWVKN